MVRMRSPVQIRMGAPEFRDCLMTLRQSFYLISVFGLPKRFLITLPNTANNTAMPYSLPHFSLLRPRKYGKQYGYSHTVAVFISEKRHFYRRGIQIYIIITPEISDARQAPIATVRSDFSKNPKMSDTTNPISAEIYEPVA